MPELHKFKSIVVTIPITSAYVEVFSALKRIKTYSHNSMTQTRLTSISLLSIEKEYIKDETKNDQFYDEVIDFFANMKNRRIPLIFKPE